MFYHKHMGVVLAVVVLLAGVAGGLAHSSQITAAKVETALNPWKVEMLEQDSLARDLSIVMGGLHQHPLISFTNPDPHLTIDRIKLVVPALDEPGDFGPDNAWKLLTLPPAAKKGTISAAVTRAQDGSFIIGWAYQGGFDGNIYVYYLEMDNQLNFVSEDTIKIIDLEQVFARYLEGKPSLSFDNNWSPRLALTLVDSYGQAYVIVYAYYNPMELTQPCDVESSGYQCDFITSQYLNYLSTPIMNLDASGSPRIAYHEGGNFMYAYPEGRPFMHPNCGPGGNTWRCIEIMSAVGTAANVFSMAKSPGTPHLAYTYHQITGDGLEVWLFSARFVGSGGNCGEDYRFGIPPVLEKRWQCDLLTSYGIDPSYTSLSTDVDHENFPVIAFNKPEGPFFNLSVAFPAERSGKDLYGGNCGPGKSWECIKVDGKGINTGLNASLALKDDGRGFIVYVEDEEYSPNLMIAYQQMYVFLPMVIR